jgi:DNA-binding beta-propeller fold protein YncE
MAAVQLTLRSASCAALLLASACADAPERAEQAAQDAPLLLVSQAGSTTVAVVDPVAAEVRARIEVGQLPHRLVRTRAGDRVYVVLVGSQAIAEIDTCSLTLTRTLLTAEVPEQRADGAEIAGHAREHAAVHTSCFDCHRPGGQKPFVVGERPVGIALSEDESRLYVSHIRGARLSELDLASGSLLRSRILPPSAAAVEASDLVRLPGRLAVALRPPQPSSEPGVVRLLDEASFETVREQAVGSDPASLLALPERQSVLVSNFDSDHLSELSEARAPAEYTVAPGPLGALALDASHVLTLDYYSNRASLLDLDSGRASALALEREGRTFVNPTHAALGPGGELYVVSSGTDGNLLVLTAGEHAIRAAIPIDGLSFDVVAIPARDRSCKQESAR